jgi:hypothetical protein
MRRNARGRTGGSVLASQACALLFKSELEDHATALTVSVFAPGVAVAPGNTVEVPRLIHHHSRGRTRSVFSSGEVVQDSLVTTGV